MAAKTPVLKREHLRQSIARKFAGNEQDGNVGLEVEFIPFRRTAEVPNKPLEISNKEKSGVCDLIRKEEAAASARFSYIPKDDGTPQFSSPEGGYITFEPGGQTEYSSSVNSELDSALKEVKTNINALNDILRKNNIWLFFGGMNPWFSPSEVGLQMKKPRYQAMNQYLESVGPYGKYMMRVTTSTQVNLDFGDPETGRKRWMAANLLSPVMTAIFSNSPYVSGRYSKAKSFRSIIWQNLDKSRTGFPHLASENIEATAPEEQYLEFALKAEVINLPDEAGKSNFICNDLTFQDWMERGCSGFFPDLANWESHLTTLFPEARAKGFIEFRAFDGQSKAWWAVPPILLTAILYDDDSVNKVTELLSPYYSKLDAMLKHAAVKGVKAFPDIARKIFRIAMNSHQFRIDDRLLEYCERFFKLYTFQESSPADDLLRLNNFTAFSADQYFDYEIRSLETASPPDSAMLPPSLKIFPKQRIHVDETAPLIQDLAACCKSATIV